MSFTVRGFKTIAADMLARFAAQTATVTDLVEGSTSRTLLEAVAQEVARVYTHVSTAIEEAIETVVYTTFTVIAKTAQPAYGQVIFTKANTGTTVIPAGTRLRVPNTTKYYKVSSGTSITDIGSVVANIVAEDPGLASNTPAGTITEIVSNLGDGNLTITNAMPLLTGADAESAEERRQRFGAYITSLHRATIEGLGFGARDSAIVDGFGNKVQVVKHSQVVEPPSMSVAYISTNSSTTVTAGQLNVITPTDMTNIAVGMRLACDTGSVFEYVRVIAVTGSTFTAYFKYAHTGAWKICASVVVYIDDGSALSVNTTSATAVTVTTTPVSQAVTPASMAGIAVGVYLQCGTTGQLETVQVTAVASTTFTATFRYTKSGTWTIVSSAASTELIDYTQKYIIDGYIDASGNRVPGYKAAGIPCVAARAQRIVQNISLDVKLDSNYTLAMVTDTIRYLIVSLFAGLNVADPLYTDTLRVLISKVEGVVYVNTLTTPGANVITSDGQILVLGTTTITGS